MNRRFLPLAALPLLWPALGGCGRPEHGGGAVGTDAAPTGAPVFSLPNLAGKTVSLAEFKGRVVFLDFWATWCPPCRASVPEVEKLFGDYRGQNLHILGMNLDEDAAGVARFVQKKGLSYPVILAGGSGVADLYGVRGIPHFVLIDKNGKVAEWWAGYSPDMPAAWRAAIDRLLVAPPAAPAQSGPRTY